MGFGLARKAFGKFKKIVSRTIGFVDKTIHKIRKSIAELKMLTIYQYQGGDINNKTTFEGDQVAIPIGIVTKIPGVRRELGLNFKEIQAEDFLSNKDKKNFLKAVDTIKNGIRGVLFLNRILPKIIRLAQIVRRVVRVLKMAIRVAGLVGFLGGPALAKKIADIVSKVNTLLDWLYEASDVIGRTITLFQLTLAALETEFDQIRTYYGITDSDYERMKLNTNDNIYYDGYYDQSFDNDIADIEEELDAVELEMEKLNYRRAPQTKADCHRFVDSLTIIDNLTEIIQEGRRLERNDEVIDRGADYERILSEEISNAYTKIQRIKQSIESNKNFQSSDTIDTISVRDGSIKQVDWRTYDTIAGELSQESGESKEEIKDTLDIYSQLDAPSDDVCPVDETEIRKRLNG